MAIRFVLDEHLRGPLWRAVQRHNARAEDPIDVVRVGDPPDLPLGSDDAAVLAWAERERRILVTCDKNTIPTHGNRAQGGTETGPNATKRHRPRQLSGESASSSPVQYR